MTLFERLGGKPAIDAVVDLMYQKIFPDPELEDFFRKTDKQRQMDMQAMFLTHVTGGPVEYTGKNMHDAHKGRGIQQREWDLVFGHVVSSMQELGVSADLIDEVGALLMTVKGDIVTA